MSEKSKSANEKGLSPREIEILTLMAAGHTNLGIAEKLGIHRNTVESQLRGIFKKISAPNRLQAILWAAKNL